MRYMRWPLALRLARRELRGGVAGFRIFLAGLAMGVGAIAGVGSLSQSVTEGLAADAAALLGGDVAVRTIHRPVSDAALAWLERGGTVSQVVHMRSMARRDDGANQALVELKAVDDAWPLFGTVVTTPPLASLAAPAPLIPVPSAPVPSAPALSAPAPGGAVPPAPAPPAAAGLRSVLAHDGESWGAAVAPGLLRRLDLTRGDTVRIGNAAFTIRATIDREPDRLGGDSGFSLGPRVLIATAALDSTGLIRPGSLVNYAYRIKLPPGTGPLAWRAGLAAAFPDAVWRVVVAGDSAPGFGWLWERLTLFLSLVGLTVLLAGGLGVANAVRGYLDGKLRVIATLKCLGASGRLVFQTFFVQTLVLALAGIGLGLLAGALLPLLAARLLESVLPVPIRFGLAPTALLLAAALGLLTTLSFAIWPVARAITVRAASLFRSQIMPVGGRPPAVFARASLACGAGLAGLAILTASDRALALGFVGGSLALLALLATLGLLVMAGARRLRGLRRPTLRLAVANLHRPGATTVNVIVSLGLGLTVLIAVALIEGNFRRQILNEIPEEAPAFFLVDIQKDQLAGLAASLAQIDGVGAIERMPMLRGHITRINGVPAREAVIDPESAWVLRGDRGITWAADPPADSPVVAGDWWPADYDGPPLVSFDAETAAGFGVGPGDTLTARVLGRDITATIANLRDITWESFGINFVMVFSPGVLEAAPFAWLATVKAAPAAEAAVETALAQAFPNVSPVRVRHVLETIGDLVRKLGLAVRAVTAVALLAGVLVVGGAIAASHRHRVYDAVVLKVLGATRRDILRAFLLEYGLLGLLTAGIATVAGSLAAWAVVVHILEFEWTLLPAPIIGTTLLCVTIALLSGFAASWIALGQKSATLLRNE